MLISCRDGEYSLSLSIASGIVDFDVSVPLTEQDAAVMQRDPQRAAFLQAALHHPFQLEATRPAHAQQRDCLDKILHAPEADTEAFLTALDHASANGAISNMVSGTCGKDQTLLRAGQWFDRPRSNNT